MASEPAKVLLLATAQEGGHAPQVFRMRLDQPLRHFAAAYATFREMSSEEQQQLRLWTVNHGELDPSATASVYGLRDNDEVVFSRPIAELETKVKGGGGSASSAGRRSTSKRTKDEACKEDKLAGVVKNNQGPACKGKRKSQVPCGPSTGMAPSSAAGTEPAAAASMRETAVKAGPAKGWRVTAWLEERGGSRPSSSLCWRAVSPGRSRAFEVCGARKGCPELQACTSEEVYKQIFGDVRPKLIQRVNECRKSIASSMVASAAAPGNGVAAQNAAEGSETPAVAKRARGGSRASASMSPKPAALNPVTPRPIAPAPCDSSALATQLFIPGGELESPEGKSWSCSCEAHLRRHAACIFTGSLQPQLLHLREYMLIGRGESCDVVLDSQRSPNMISRCHAVLHQEEGHFVIVDQGSMNGLLVNGEKVDRRRTLKNRDVVTFGVTMPQPEFDYIFETRPTGQGSPVEAEDVW
eukprot:TRINITY_DN90984_c0_g1_i1.p1 TRINITY_DN90984_c0_g1~~TRINITY_DN90984_c0_g1_i1.p1  ORF type:complete len:478 (-),score=112.90 TRINITY_DN90984_c0_g1_i1:29-1435(-)